MTPDFVRRFAPKLMLSAAKSNDMPSSDAGLNTEPRYDASGTPLPYIQQGDTREYFGTEGGLAPQEQPYATSGTPLPYIQQSGERQYFGTPGTDGLRGRIPTEANIGRTPFIRDMPTPGLNDGLRGRLPFGTAPTEQDGLHGRLPMDPSTIAPPENLLRGRRYVPGTPIPIPSDARAYEDRIMGGIRDGRIDPITPDVVMERIRNPQGATLADLLSSMNFQIPNFLRQPDGLRGRTRAVVDIPPNDNYIRNANTLGDYPDFSSDTGLAEFNRRTRLNLRNQVRSQAEQDSLRARGATTAVASWHTVGGAADIHPRDIDGLTGNAAVAEVRRRLNAAGYRNMEVIWETGRGAGQGTGPHVHIEPPGRPTRRAQ